MAQSRHKDEEKRKAWRARQRARHTERYNSDPEYKEHIRQKARNAYSRNPEKEKTRHTEWVTNNRDKARESARQYYHESRKNNISWALRNRLGNRIRMALKRGSKKTNVTELCGCSLDFLMGYLASSFQEGMSWENFGEWHIDHIKPCLLFNLDDQEEQKKCFNYTNLQPLWKIDNLKKGTSFAIEIR
jgi:hypothetical protein